MKKLVIGIVAALALPTVVFAGDAFDGISNNVEKNGAFEAVTVGPDDDREDFVTTGDVIIGDGIRASANGKAGPRANSRSVVGTLERTGCSGGTRVDLPGGGGSDC